MPSTTSITSEQAAAILREVPAERSFHFYRGIDAPLNVSARSLNEFLERVKTVEPASLAFHSERQDFERWVAMLGDNELSKRLKAVRASRLHGEALRTRLYSATKSRVDQLARLSMKKHR